MKKFQLGLCMPGAVTSGAYTAGAIDYILQVLDRWEAEKENKDLPVPYIELSTVGGTSAGGMSSIMLLLQLLGKEDLLYEAWVNLDDDEKEKTLSKALDSKDILKARRIPSLLNSQFIDNITDRAFELSGSIDESLNGLPSYLSKDFSVILSHALLNGVPLSLDLGSEYTSYRRVKSEEALEDDVEPLDYVTYEHSFFSFFNINKERSHIGENKTSPYIWFNPFLKESAEKIKIATQATGAFPIGLSPRMFSKDLFSKDLVLASVKKSILSRYQNIKIGEKELLTNDKTDWNKVFKHVNDQFESLTIDGGAMNNAPIGQILAELRSKTTNAGDSTFGLIQIDPYPNRYDEKKDDYKPKWNILPFAQDIISTLWGGNKTKRDEIANQNIGDFVIGEIFPTQRVKEGKNISDEKVLATSSLKAFGGILSRKFREHDYQLGRENARNFLRYKYFFPVNKEDEVDVNYDNIRSIWEQNPQAKEKFIRYHNVIKKGEKVKIPVLPIIPDIGILEDDDTYFSKIERPKVSSTILKPYEKEIKTRIRAIIDNINLSLKEEKSSNKKILRKIIKILYVKKIYRMLNNMVIEDLKQRDLLDGKTND